jgi:hypothetical protein
MGRSTVAVLRAALGALLAAAAGSEDETSLRSGLEDGFMVWLWAVNANLAGN